MLKQHFKMSENDKIEQEIDVRSVKTPEELKLITKEIEKEVESEVEIEGKLMEGVDEAKDLNKKNYTKITPTFYIKPVESEKKDDKSEKIQVYDILNPLTETIETRELTDEEKREIQILHLKESHIKFHPIKHQTVKSKVTSMISTGIFDRKRKVKSTTISTNVTTNQFGADYRKARKNKNRMSRASRKVNR